MSCSRLDCKPVKGRTKCNKCRMSEWRLKNPLPATYNQIKSRAKQRGIGFYLTLEQFKSFCKDTGYLEKKGKEADSMSIDRIKNSIGYRLDNIRVISLSENTKRQRKGLNGWNSAQPKQAEDPF